MTKIHLDIEGMSCGHCVRAVREALSAVDGVEVRDVSIGSADIAVDERRAPPDRILDAVADAGYQATIGSAA